MHEYEVRPRGDERGFDLISGVRLFTRRRNLTRKYGVTPDKEVQVTRRCRVRRAPAQPNPQ